MDLVKASGLDVAPWAFTKAGEPVENPASNGRFCYDWAFTDGHKKFTFCLWHAECTEDGDSIYYRGNIRAAIQRGEVGGPRRKRADAFDTAVQNAFFGKVPVRVVIVDGYTRQARDDTASKVGTRLLDPNHWQIASYDYDTGEFVFRRLGAKDLLDAPTPSNDADGSHEPDSLTLDEQKPNDAAESDLAEDIADIYSDPHLQETERQALVQARIGQGEFRRQLMAKWEGRCAVTGCDLADVLRASHCKPWCDGTHAERLNSANGLLLSANLDALFDRYLISFEDDGEMLVSSRISEDHRRVLSLPGRLRRLPTEAERHFLGLHRTVFLSRQQA